MNNEDNLTLIFHSADGSTPSKIGISNNLESRTLLEGKKKYMDYIDKIIDNGLIELVKKGNHTITLEDGTIEEIPHFEEEITCQPKNIKELHQFLKKSFNCELSHETVVLGSGKAHGKGCGYDEGLIDQIIETNFKKAIRELFSSAHHAIGSTLIPTPRLATAGGSYTVNILDTSTDQKFIDQTKVILNSIQSLTIDQKRYFEDKHYQRLIDNLCKLSGKQGLDHIDLTSGDGTPYHIDQTTLHKLVTIKNQLNTNRTFERKSSSARALDFVYNQFALDDNNHTICTTTSEILNKINDNLGAEIQYTGYYLSKKTVQINNIEIL